MEKDKFATGHDRCKILRHNQFLAFSLHPVRELLKLVPVKLACNSPEAATRGVLTSATILKKRLWNR